VILVDHATEDMMAMDRPVLWDHRGGVVIRRLVVKTLVRSVVVVVASELAQHHRGVTFMVDQHPISALGANAAHEPLGIAVFACGTRTGVRTTSMPWLTNTASNDGMNLLCPDPGSRTGSQKPGLPDPR
jgi:hypothetical protein